MSFWTSIRDWGESMLPKVADFFVPGSGAVVQELGGALGMGPNHDPNVLDDYGNPLWGSGSAGFGGSISNGGSGSMPSWLTGIGSAIGSLAGNGPVIAGGLGWLGQSQTNAANAAEAQKNRDFQHQETSTSWQRGVTDMKAAGLNPMLAYSQGGASSGGGAQATMGNSLGAGVSTAIQAATTKAQIDQAVAQTSQAEANANLQRAQARNIDVQTINEGIKTGTYKSEAESAKYGPGLQSEELNRRQLANYVTNAAMQDTLAQIHSSASLTAAQVRHTNYGLSKDKAESKFFDDNGTGPFYADYGLRALSSAGAAFGRLR